MVPDLAVKARGFLASSNHIYYEPLAHPKFRLSSTEIGTQGAYCQTENATQGTYLYIVVFSGKNFIHRVSTSDSFEDTGTTSKSRIPADQS